MAFQPKQITHYEAKRLVELQGDVSDQAIEYSLSLIPPFSLGNEYTIHDNACDVGAVTQAIMTQAQQPTKTNLTIDATDINAQFVAGCAALAKEKHWPVKTAVMSAQELAFPADRFTHSFTTFAFHCLSDHDNAAKQVYRTLKPGGMAIASIWLDMPHVNALHHAHWRTRGKKAPLPTLLPMEGLGEDELRKPLEAGGFGAI
jgi:ubiquinone/menaquinone biosynthesis C-methylase UbiE